MADDHGAVDLQVLQDRARVSRHVVKAVGNDRLRRSAVADLIGNDDAEAGLAEHIDRPAEVKAREVVAVQEHHRMTVGGAARRDIHERDANVLTNDGSPKTEIREIPPRVSVRTATP